MKRSAADRRALRHELGLHEGGRRRWDLPPNVTKVLLAWAAAGPALTVWLGTR